MKQLNEWSPFDVMREETMSASQLMSDLEDTVEDAENWVTRCHNAEAAVFRLNGRDQLRW